MFKRSLKIDGIKVHGLSFKRFVALLEDYGYKNIAGLSSLPVNPMEWRQQDWDFVETVVSEAIRKDASKLKPSTLLKIFGEALRQTQIFDFLKLLAEESKQAVGLLKTLETPEKWDVTWRNVA